MTPQHSDQDDIVVELTKDHDEVRELFAKIRKAGKGKQREDLVREVTVELVKHSVAEEAHLYPVARDALSDGDQVADSELHDHAEVEKLLKELERMDQDDADYGPTLDKLMSEVEQHATEEEQELFPALRRACSEERLHELGDKVRMTKKVAPTHPHPSAPDTPPANRVAAPMAGLVDSVRDAMSK